MEVICEGYDYPDDPYILKGSCGLEYTLELTKEGHNRQSNSYNHDYGYGGSNNYNSGYYSSKKNSTGMGDLIVFGVVCLVIYALYKTCIDTPGIYMHLLAEHLGTLLLMLTYLLTFIHQIIKQWETDNIAPPAMITLEEVLEVVDGLVVEIINNDATIMEPVAMTMVHVEADNEEEVLVEVVDFGVVWPLVDSWDTCLVETEGKLTK